MHIMAGGDPSESIHIKDRHQDVYSTPSRSHTHLFIMSSTPVKVTEGYIPFVREGQTYQTYYKIFGDLENRTRTPVVGVHGGPGLVHDYLAPFSDLTASAGVPVVLYDQLGNGLSTHLREKPPAFWTIGITSFACSRGARDEHERGSVCARREDAVSYHLEYDSVGVAVGHEAGEGAAPGHAEAP